MIAALLLAWRWLYRLSMPVLIAALLLVGATLFFSVKLAGAVHARKVAEREANQLHAEIDDPKVGWRAKLSRCETSVDDLTRSLEDQNKAVQQLKDESDQRTRRANAAIAEARRQARGLQARVMTLQAKTPASGDLCASARQLIVETLSEDRR